jgi:hypothetical protein
MHEAGEERVDAARPAGATSAAGGGIDLGDFLGSLGQGASVNLNTQPRPSLLALTARGQEEEREREGGREKQSNLKLRRLSLGLLPCLLSPS